MNKLEVKNVEKIVIEIPKGVFCGNCSDCVYYQSRNTDQHGRGYCGYYGTHYYPQDRNGCFNYERR